MKNAKGEHICTKCKRSEADGARFYTRVRQNISGRVTFQEYYCTLCHKNAVVTSQARARRRMFATKLKDLGL